MPNNNNLSINSRVDSYQLKAVKITGQAAGVIDGLNTNTRL